MVEELPSSTVSWTGELTSNSFWATRHRIEGVLLRFLSVWWWDHSCSGLRKSNQGNFSRWSYFIRLLTNWTVSMRSRNLCFEPDWIDKQLYYLSNSSAPKKDGEVVRSVQLDTVSAWGRLRSDRGRSSDKWEWVRSEPWLHDLL